MSESVDDLILETTRRLDLSKEDQISSISSTTNERDYNKKREDYIDWHEFFMATAFLAAKRSKDPCSQVGACIVNKQKKIVSIGYNGMPIGCDDDDFPWRKDDKTSLEHKSLYVCHAEMNAIVNKNSANVADCTIYVALFPCNECAKIIIQSGIKEVIYASDKHSHKLGTKAAKRMFDAAGVSYWSYRPSRGNIVIDFAVLDESSASSNTDDKLGSSQR